MSQLITTTNGHSVDPPVTDRAVEDPFEPLSVGAMVDRVAAMAVEKAAHPWAFFVRSLVGGAFVSFGVLLALVVSTGVKTPGVASLLMGLAFGMSFVLILVSGMSLITADMAAGFLAVLKRTMSLRTYAFLSQSAWSATSPGPCCSSPCAGRRAARTWAPSLNVPRPWAP
jgi:hypothetical protein